MLPADSASGLITLAIFATVNLAGVMIWSRREQLPPLPAIQGLVVLVGLASALVTYVLDSAGRFESLGVGGQVSARSMYLILALMVPGLLLLFHLVGRESSRE